MSIKDWIADLLGKHDAPPDPPALTIPPELLAPNPAPLPPVSPTEAPQQAEAAQTTPDTLQGPVTAQTPFRSIGDLSREAWVKVLTEAQSPLLGWVDEIIASCPGYGALGLAQAFKESSLGKEQSARRTNNPLGLLDYTGANPVQWINGLPFQVFASWPDAFVEFRYRLSDLRYKNGVYGPQDLPLQGFIYTYVGGPGCWTSRGATCANGETKVSVDLYLNQTIERINAWKQIGEPLPDSEPITYGNVTHPAYQDRPVNKPAGQGWDDLGQRSPKGIVLHRMVGTLDGTDSWFRSPGVGALTDYGVGVLATDGASKDGTLYRWNDPLGRRSGWASGPVSSPYGDGKAFVNKYGATAVNRDLISIEISGQYTTPLSDNAFETIAHLIAYWADYCKVPYTSFPLNPATGINFVFWHQEFTIGTGKVCPGQVVMDRTTALIDRARAILKDAQTGSDTTPPPPPPDYAKPVPVPFPWTGLDVVHNNTPFIAVKRSFRAKEAGVRVLQYADAAARDVRAPLAKNERVEAEWAVKANDGHFYIISPYGSRIRADDLLPAWDWERIVQ